MRPPGRPHEAGKRTFFLRRLPVFFLGMLRPLTWRARVAGAVGLVAHSLSGRLLLLTLFYVLISEAVISVPTIARYHHELLNTHIESAEIAILPFTEIGDEQFSATLRRQLLMRAGADAVMLKRREQRELFLVQGMPETLDRTIDLSRPGLWNEIVEAANCLFEGGDRMLRIISATHRNLELEVKEGRFLLCKLLLLLCLTQVWIHTNIMLPFILAQIQNLEGPVVLPLRFELPLHADHSLTRGVNGELAQVRGDPLSTELLGEKSICTWL